MRTIIATVLFLVSVPLLATPSTLIWIPSTDIQPTKVWHYGVDSYIYGNGGQTAPSVDTGLTYGVVPRVEVGIDYASPFTRPDGTLTNPLWFNAKVALHTPTEKLPLAVSAGIYNVGIESGTSQAPAYVVASYPLAGMRATFGGYQGRSAVLGASHKGVLAGLDRTIGRWWFGVDYQGGKNLLGALNFGAGYAFSDKVGVIVGYDHYNAPAIVGVKSSGTIQVDINF